MALSLQMVKCISNNRSSHKKIIDMTRAKINHPLSPVFDHFWNGFFEGGKDIAKALDTGFSPPKVNIRELDSGYSIELAVPGMKKENFDLAIEKDLLIVKGSTENREEGSGKNEEASSKELYKRREFSIGVFERRFHLPETINKEGIDAIYDAGILKIFVPKLEDNTVESSRKIEVK